MRGRRDGLLDALCWCGATTVDVTPDAVRAGITGTCGRDGCTPPGTPPHRTVWAILDPAPSKPTRPRKTHGHKGKAQPTGRDRERTARRLAGPPPEAA